MSSQARLLSSKTLYRGRVFQLKRDRIVEPGNITATREVVEHAGSVVVMPFLPNGHVILIRQFRYPARQSLWELVAGSMEPGESVIRAARRELLEETGYSARSWKRILYFWASPGFVAESMSIYLARDLTAGTAQPEADEAIELRLVPLQEAVAMVMSGKIHDGKTISGILWLHAQQNQ